MRRMPPTNTKTALLIEYVDLSWKFDFPPEIEVGFEQDYVTNHYLYDENSWERVALLLLIAPSTTATEAVQIARGLIVNDIGSLPEASNSND